ncbi:MAG: hypothetical protein ACR2LL_06620 [Nitrosopumilus sp.]|uniref:hypothetical protein n=1 Tax=Nitrosopumilus sp. TaxID=2024843 RepID=UPI00292CEBBD|nr:hypothetical protein [Nitrosopumilus sp.]
MDITSIQVSKRSKKKWDSFKNHPQESYENMINRILKTVQEDDSDLLTAKDLQDIEKSIKEIKSGKYTTNKELRKELGL